MKTAQNNKLGPVVQVRLALIDPNPKNRDLSENDPDLKPLADSIRDEGLLLPIVLRSLKGGRYGIVAGERRYLAHKLNKATEIDARILESDDAGGAARKRLVENMQRKDLTPIEQARGFQELAQDFKMTQADIAKTAGVAQPTVANALRLLDLPADVQQLVQEEKLSRAHGVALAKWARWPVICSFMAKRTVAERTSSKDLERQTLPFDWHLREKKLIVRILTESWGGAPTYKVPPAMQKDPDFLKWGSEWICLVPAKWAPEAARQDEARVKAAAAEAAKAKKAGATGKKTPEQLSRAKVIAGNKAARARIAESKAAVFKRLKESRTLDVTSLSLLCRNVGGHRSNISEVAQEIGVKLPKGFTSSTREHWLKLSPADAVRVCAAAVVREAAHQASRFASSVPAEIQFLLSAKGGRK